MSLSNKHIIEHLISGKDLDTMMMQELMDRILSGTMPAEQIAAALVLLRAKKETAFEIAQSAEAVMNKAKPIVKPEYLYTDIVGTGGDGYNTINVSTLASLTAASLGLPVAKHGNTSVSSRCGSADILRELGVDISLSPHNARHCLDTHSWCFLFAPLYHPAFTSVKDVRKNLKIKTIFNILGPLVNPLAPPIMLIGVYDPKLIAPMACALKELGKKRALIVHGSGLDEIALHGPTTAMLLDDKTIKELHITPKALGLKTFALETILGGSPKHNAHVCKAILSGTADEAKTTMVALSTGALLWLGEKAPSIQEGIKHAIDALRSKKPMHLLQRIKECTYGS